MKIKMLALLFLLSINACAYVNIKMPLDDDVNDTQLGSKIGYSRSHSIAWLVAWGDGGTAAAAKDGGITTIKHLDQHFIGVLFGLYTQRETIVYGD